MVIDFTQQLKNPLTGEAVYREANSKEVSTLSDICINALVASLKGDEGISGVQKFQYWEIAKKIYNSKVEVSSEEIVKIKERIGKMYAALLVGIVYDLLESKE